MVITPSTDIYLLKSPLEISDINQLTFSNATAQYNYFNSLPKIGVSDYSYQRKDGTIRYGGNFDDIIGYNYVMYRNDAYSNKWFYAYITGMEYLNDNVTAVSIKTDVWQTYQFELSYKPVFVEREHVNDDTFGKHTIPENLETGEFIRGLNGAQSTYNSFWLAFQVTELISNMDDVGTGTHRLYNGIYNGLYIVLVDDYTTADLLVSAYDDAGKHESIISCFYIPKNVASNPITNSGCVLHGQTRTIYFPRPTTTATTIDSLRVTRPTTIDGYTPKNNKMFTREFCYMLASNNSGSDVTYNFEDFRDISTGEVVDTPTFIVRGTLGQGANIRLYPDNEYKSPTGTPSYTSFNSVAKYGITAGKLPVCSWNSDYYTNWLTQNAVNIPMDAVGTGLSTVGSLLSGNAIGAVSTLINGVGNMVNKKYQAELVPHQAKGNVNCGDINFSEGLHLTITTMTIRAEMARCCDEFLSQFGYKVNRVKVPNIRGRRNWNYVKTIGCYIEGEIPQDDLAEIKGMFDKGVTFWHNPNTFMDYSQNNDII